MLRTPPAPKNLGQPKGAERPDKETVELWHFSCIAERDNEDDRWRYRLNKSGGSMLPPNKLK